MQSKNVEYGTTHQVKILSCNKFIITAVDENNEGYIMNHNLTDEDVFPKEGDTGKIVFVRDDKNGHWQFHPGKPEPEKTPTNIEALRLYAKYIGQKVKHEQGGMERTLIGLGGFDDGDYQYITARLGDYKGHKASAFIDEGHGRWKILLKSLRDISRDQMEVLMRMRYGGWPAGYYYSVEALEEGSKVIIDEILAGRPVHCEIIEWCYENGYAVPYKHWKVEQLIQFGFYKLIEQKQ